jgi:hypothetical protein
MPRDLPASTSQNVNLSLQIDTEGAIVSLTVINSTDSNWEALIRGSISGNSLPRRRMVSRYQRKESWAYPARPNARPARSSC